MRHRRRLPSRPARSWLPALTLALATLMPAGLSPLLAAPQRQGVLRVGAVEGAQPCSARRDGVWQGLAVQLWSAVASRDHLAFVWSSWPSTRELLRATARGEVDVAVGCINVSPDRLALLNFSLPFQEDGLAVMVLRTRLDLGRAFLATLLGPELLQLLGGFLLINLLLALFTWRLEDYEAQPGTWQLGRRRTFAKLFQVLVTGPGGNTIVTTISGNAVVICAYVVRIVAASLLVGFLTVNVVRESQNRAQGRINSLEDLHGLQVGVRPGSVSESLLLELNARNPAAARVRVVRLPTLAAAVPLLRAGTLEAVLADNLQLTYLLAHQQGSRFVGSLPLQGIRPESQAFAYSPRLDRATIERIDLAISSLKRSGIVGKLRREAIAAPL
jgi:ABC-type amino acid transport substrate-binding protein